MKKIAVLLTLAFLSSCQKINYTPVNIDLGVVAKTTSIAKLYPVVSNGQVTVELNVTAGAKYSLQITDLLENEIKTFGFTADNDIYIRKLDLTGLKNGDYNLVLIDISGKESRTNLIIKN